MSNLRTSEDLFSDELRTQLRCQLVHVSELRHVTFSVVEILTHRRVLVIAVVSVTVSCTKQNHQHQSYILNSFPDRTDRQTDRQTTQYTDDVKIYVPATTSGWSSPSLMTIGSSTPMGWFMSPPPQAVQNQQSKISYFFPDRINRQTTDYTNI